MKALVPLLLALALVLVVGEPPDVPHALLPGEGAPERVVVPERAGPDAGDRPGLLPGEQAPQRILAQPADEPLDWGVNRIQAPAAWKTTRGRGVKVAVLDTGCDLNHPDLAGAVVAARDFTGSPAGAADANGHGTHVAGVVAGRAAGRGVVGVAPECSLLVVKVLADHGSGSDVGIAAGIDWAVAQGADVLSLSFGSPQASPRIHAALQRATRAGVVVVAAAGNAGPGEGSVGYPGAFAESVCVAATDANDRVARFSSRGPAVFVAAPGVVIRSTYPGGRYAEMSGTSMACPHVSAAAALWVAAHPDVAKADRPAAFKKALAAACRDLAPPGRDTASGHGLLDAAALVAGAQPPPPPAAGFTLTEDDLTPAAKDRLHRAFPGARLRLEFGVPAERRE